LARNGSDRAHQEFADAGVHIGVDFMDLLVRQDADHRHRRQGGVVLDFGQQGAAAQVRIAKVEKHHVEVARAQPRHRRRRRLGDELGGAALAAQHLDRAAPGGARVIHDQRRFLVVAQTPLPLGAYLSSLVRCPPSSRRIVNAGRNRGIGIGRGKWYVWGRPLSHKAST
jgi:hypothetical protein